MDGEGLEDHQIGSNHCRSGWDEHITTALQELQMGFKKIGRPYQEESTEVTDHNWKLQPVKPVEQGRLVK